ncbi:MAG: aldo/keto reductase [Alphaproteobacteria bacterium]
MRMKTIGAGDAAISIPAVGLGCNAFGRRIDAAATGRVVHAAIDAGITFFDTAEGYGNGQSEDFIGRALGARRGQVVIATKFGWGLEHVPGKGTGSRENIRIAVEGSLKRLRTDVIDLYQIHKPDPKTPIGETLAAMDALVTEGKVRLIGCSNFSTAQLDEAMRVARDAGISSFVTAQNRWSVLNRGIEDDLAPACASHGVGILPYYPLERGLLTGKYRRGEAAPEGARLGGAETGSADFDTIEALERFAISRGHDLLTLAVSWLASKDVVASVISGASRPEQLAVNAAAGNWELTPDDYAEIDRILT